MYGVQTHDHECTHVIVSHSLTPEPPPPLDKGNSMGVPLLLEGDKKGTLTLDRRVDSTKCQGVKQEGLEVAARWAKSQHKDN